MDGMIQIIQTCPKIKTLGSFKRPKSVEKEVKRGLKYTKSLFSAQFDFLRALKLHQMVLPGDT